MVNDTKITSYPRSGWQNIIDKALSRCRAYRMDGYTHMNYQLGGRAAMRGMSALAELHVQQGGTPGDIMSPPPRLTLEQVSLFYEHMSELIEHVRHYGQFVLSCFDDDHGTHADDATPN